MELHFKVLKEKKSIIFKIQYKSPSRIWKFGHRHSGECHVKMEAEIGVRHQ